MQYCQFQSTPPARGATLSSPAYKHYLSRFQSTPPARGATRRLVFGCWMMMHDFNPRPPRGGRRWSGRPDNLHLYFNPRPPRGGRLSTPSGSSSRSNFNPRPPRGGRRCTLRNLLQVPSISIHAPREGGDSKDAQFYLRIFDKQVELLRFLGKIRGGCLRNPEKDRRFLGKSLANLPEISGHLDFAGGGKARPGYPCAVPLPRRAACVRGSGDPPADRCSSYRNAPLFSHIASLDSKSADCLSQNP